MMCGFGNYLKHLARIQISPTLVVRVSELPHVPAGALVRHFRVLHLPWLLRFLVPTMLTAVALWRRLPEGSAVVAPFAAAAG